MYIFKIINHLNANVRKTFFGITSTFMLFFPLDFKLRKLLLFSLAFCPTPQQKSVNVKRWF